MPNNDRNERYYRMKNILFIVPMHTTFEDFISPSSNARNYRKADGKCYGGLPTDLPLGILSMSAYLKKHSDVNVRLIDFNVELNCADSFDYSTFYEYCNDYFKNYSFAPDIVGISSLFSPSFYNFLEAGQAAKASFPFAMIIGGGHIPTSSYRRIFREMRGDCFDAIAYGEGEKPLLELVMSDDAAAYLKSNDSWITIDKIASDHASFVPRHNNIENLDEIPFYDYDLVVADKHGLNPVMSSYGSIKNTKGYHVMTSRGCPFKCTFCASHRVHGRKMRYHSVARVIDDLSILKTQYGASTIVFQDDHLMGNKNRVHAFLDAIGKMHLEVVFQNGLTISSLDKEMLKAFYAAGIRQLVLPVESGSDRVLRELMRKPLKFSTSKRVVDNCRELGIYTNVNVLVGMPGETRQDIEDGLSNLLTLDANWFHIVCASPLVGSEMHEICLKMGFIDGETLGADYRKAVINTPDFSAEYIQEKQYLMNLELNFVRNSDIRLGDYKTALMGLTNVIRVKDDHCFAYYYAALCYRELMDYEQSEKCFSKAVLYSKDAFWKKYILHFGLRFADMMPESFLEESKVK